MQGWRGAQFLEEDFGMLKVCRARRMDHGEEQRGKGLVEQQGSNSDALGLTLGGVWGK